MALLLEKIRRSTFWFLDSLKGGKLKSHYNDIKFILENFDKPEAIKKREEALDKILYHSVNTSEFYKKFKDFKTLNDFPVIDKITIRENTEAFKSSKYPSEKLFTVITSGSTGTPFKTFQDGNKKLRNTADTMYYGKLSGSDVGNLLIYAKIWSAWNKKSSLLLKMQNVYPLDVIKLTDEKISEFIEWLKGRKDTISILGYPSGFESVCNYLDRKGVGRLNVNVKSIIGMSETFNQGTKDSMKKHFGVTPVSRYSNIENGILAQQCIEENNEYHLNFASYYIEIFDLVENKPVPEGMFGRIIVTDLYNYGMPLIRYDSGDVGTLSYKAKCNFKTPVLTVLEGRKLDLIYDTSGQLVSSYIVYKNMWNYTEIVQYQFIQKDKKDYIFKINTDDSFNRENELINEFKEFLGQDANIVIERVKEIPLLDSGKRKKVVNLMNSKK